MDGQASMPFGSKTNMLLEISHQPCSCIGQGPGVHSKLIPRWRWNIKPKHHNERKRVWERVSHFHDFCFHSDGWLIDSLFPSQHPLHCSPPCPVLAVILPNSPRKSPVSANIQSMPMSCGHAQVYTLWRLGFRGGLPVMCSRCVGFLMD